MLTTHGHPGHHVDRVASARAGGRLHQRRSFTVIVAAAADLLLHFQQ